MRNLLIVVGLLAIVPLCGVCAEDQSGVRIPLPLNTPERVRILPDQKNGLVVFEIDGRPVAQLDPRGLSGVRPPPPIDPPARVRILTDQKAGTVTFEIDGKPVARIDRLGLWANGVRVSGDIRYSGTVMNTPVDAPR
jgi:hypothetical protein